MLLVYLVMWGLEVKVKLPLVSQVGQYIENKYAMNQLHCSKDEGMPTENRNILFKCAKRLLREHFVRGEY